MTATGLLLRTDRQCHDCPTIMVNVGHTRRYCDLCRAKRKRKSEQAAQDRWRAANPDKRPTYNRRSALKRKYGLTEADVERMYVEQGGRCAIPSCPNEATRVDHCHDTGVVRGLLCHGCNIRLSGLEDLEWKVRAEKYLMEKGGRPDMSITKHGHGEILKEDAETKKTSSATQEDLDALAAENAEADR